MSTIKVTNIQDTSGGNQSTSEQIAEGRAKAWVSFNGDNTVAISDSFNVSSITDQDTGRYLVNFTTNFANTNYCVTHGASYSSGNGNYHWYDNEAVGSVQLGFIHSGGSYTDPPHVSCVIHAGD